MNLMSFRESAGLKSPSPTNPRKLRPCMCQPCSIPSFSIF